MDTCRHIASPFVNQMATSLRRAVGRALRLYRRSDIYIYYSIVLYYI